MAKLNIGGQVLYKDMQTPAANALVQIWDLDEGGDGHDKIFEVDTNNQGQFSGLSSEWNDRNTVRIRTPFGTTIIQEMPDIMTLEFRVTANGQTHRGPYFHTGDNASVPIILPWLPIEKSQRELIHLITLSEDRMDAADELLYEAIEFGAALTSSSLLGAHYNKIHLLQKQQATLDMLCQQLESIASRASTRAIDVIFSTHGLDGKVYFYPNVESSIAEVSGSIRRLPTASRKKFRMVFSTACFGASHLQAWLDTGFKVTSGSIGVYADSLFSFPTFLSMWKSGKTFKEAVDAANLSDPLRTQDNLARDKYEDMAESERSKGNTRSADYYADLATKINSYRRIKGKDELKIFSAP